MILKTEEFKNVCKNILLAVEDSANNLELNVDGSYLYLNVTNNEYYVSIKMELENPVPFHAVVDAELFLNLIAGINTETFEICIEKNTVVISVGKSKYKLPMIFENDTLMSLKPIIINNQTLEMPIKNDILMSILNVNSKELLKVKNIDVQEVQKLYYIDECGCFCFSTGACLNEFTLEKPVKLLLNDRIVKLFRLFKDDVDFALGQDFISEDKTQTKVVFKTSNTYLAAIITCDDALINRVQGPCNATKRFINEPYANRVVLSTGALTAALSRLLLFSKNSNIKAQNHSLPATFTVTSNEVTIADNLGNTEVINVENESFISDSYSMILNLIDLKLVLDSCKETHLTMSCGNHRSVILTRGTVKNLIPEGQQA